MLTSPLMLLGLLGLPALGAIYWLRSRSRRVVVSSLVLWSDQRRARQGGRIIERMQTPLTFFLELLVILLCVAAAAGPALVKRDVARPLVVVLDDSYSMRAKGTVPFSLGRKLGQSPSQSPRQQAEAALMELLGHDSYVARLLTAGNGVRSIGESIRTAGEAQPLLDAWTCQSGGADLHRGIATATEIGGAKARILVLSDHPPPMPLGGGQIQWWAFGARLPNMAITAATRTYAPEQERLLIEVTNPSDAAGRTVLTLQGGNLAAPKIMPVDLAHGAAKQFFLNLPLGAAPVQASLGEDVLDVDNRAILLPEPAKPLRIRLDVTDAELRRTVQRVLDATEMALIVTEKPELSICDARGSLPTSAWRLEILGGGEPSAYAGPFVIDRNHPLTQGLSLEGAIWSGRAEPQLGGAPLIMAGSVPLLSDHRDGAGRHTLRMNFALDKSNLQDLPDWPILFTNLLRWRRTLLPGVVVPNVRLGQTVGITLADDVRQAEVLKPDGSSQELDVHNQRIEVPAERVGTYTVKTPDASYQFSCNAVSRDESDLSACQSGRWGDWNDSPVHEDRRVSIGWALLLGAMACLAVHAMVIARKIESNK